MNSQFLLIALATFASEDLTLAATGVLVSQGEITFGKGVAACAAGIFAGDLLLFLTGRALGSGLQRWPRLARLLARVAPPDRIQRGAAWLTERGMIVVLLSRFTPGLRLPTYVAAGLLPTRLSKFALYFLVAALIWTPLFVGAAGTISAGVVAPLLGPAASGLPAFGALAGLLWLGRTISTHRRRIAGFLRRKTQWEFWPAWAAYLPVVPYLLFLAIRHRSLTLFTAANPGIPTGGFVGESKYAILQALAAAGAHTGSFEPIPGGGLSVEQRTAIVLAFATRHGDAWPVVLKPDMGERGAGVAIVRSPDEAARYLAANPEPAIVQSFLPGHEFGIFYYRFPNEERGRIFSITEKRFPRVTGDGRRSLRELILDDPRASCLAATYLRLAKRGPETVPAESEEVPLVEIGSHCRGAIFLDGGAHRTAALEAEVDRISRAIPGFYFGRYDVRSRSTEDLRAGRFSVIELNGVAAEATHIYDPAVPVWSAYRSLFAQWRVAFAIGAANRAMGARPSSVSELVRAIVGRRRGNNK